MIDQVLQASQFFRERVGRVEDYERRHKNGHAATDADDDNPSEADTREVAAHKNVFGR